MKPCCPRTLLALLTALFAAVTCSAVPWRWFNYGINGHSRSVFTIMRDSADRAWLGTNSGLYLFNGYETYATNNDGTTFVSQTYALTQVNQHIYVGTNDGLFRLNPETLEIENIDADTPQEIRALVYDGRWLWIGSLNGLFRYDITNNIIKGPVTGLTHNAVYSLLLEEDALFVGTYNGLCRITNDRVEAMTLNGVSTDSGNCFVNALCKGHNGEIYIGLETGLTVYNTTSGAAKQITACDGNSIKTVALLDTMVVAGSDNGLFVISDSGDVQVYRHDANRTNSIMCNVVWSLWSDSGDNLWAGTELGLAIADINSPVQILSLADMTGFSDGQQVYSLFRDSRTNLWVGGTNGLICVNRNVGSSRHYAPGRGTDNLSHTRVRDIMESSDGYLWVATDGGLNILDPTTYRFNNHRITDKRHSVNANWAYSILEDMRDSTVWVAGFLGGIFVEQLSRFRAEGTLHCADTVYTADKSMPNALIGQLLEDCAGNKWVLHYRNRSITRIDADTRRASLVSLDDVTGTEPTMLCASTDSSIWCALYNGVIRLDLNGHPIGDIAEFPFYDHSGITAMSMVTGQPWIATEQAVYTINPQSMKASLLPLPQMNYTSIYVDPLSGNVLLGSIDRIVSVDIERFNRSLTQRRINIRQIKANGEASSFYGTEYSKSVDLPNGTNDIEISLAVDRFEPGQYNRFCYSIDGSEWRLLDVGDNKISFNTLTPGSHHLRIALAGHGESEYSLTINVAYPWYVSTIAFVCYALLILIAVALSIRHINRLQQRKVEDAERRSVLASVERRQIFLSNISHELKTPLSMIIGPLSRVRGEQLPDATQSDIDAAYNNAMRLNTLLHQAIELNNSDDTTDSILIFSRIDAVAFCRDTVQSYSASVHSHNFIFDSQVRSLNIRVDVIKLESLLNNLITNAIKYSKPGSNIIVALSLADLDFKITVTDEGVGIPVEEQNLIFERLYRSGRTASTAEGTGIGLYIVRRYVTMMGGAISLHSAEGQGSSFTITLPISGDGKDCDMPEVTSSSDICKPRVLIVDDNHAIASFIASVLAEDFACTTADNGKTGLSLSSALHPDIIITDEMMPVMDGIEMAHRIRSNATTASTPILLLTAKDTADTYAASIEADIDVFMSKPFDANVLSAKVKQLLTSRAHLRQKENLATLTDASTAETPISPDEKRLTDITSVIESNLSNPELNVTYLSEHTAISQKTLYRLIMKYTGVSPSDYIRQTRLRQAAALLEQGAYSVSEVMYMVGFSSSSYFAKCFTRQFGCSPGNWPPKDKTL